MAAEAESVEERLARIERRLAELEAERATVNQVITAVRLSGAALMTGPDPASFSA